MHSSHFYKRTMHRKFQLNFLKYGDKRLPKWLSDVKNNLICNVIKDLLTFTCFYLFLLASYNISEGSNYYRSCSSGYYLRITYARWHCSNNSWTVTSLVNSKCNYNTACTLYATDSWLGGDPCPGVTTYLYWTNGCYCEY